jgi:hypothetical protein
MNDAPIHITRIDVQVDLARKRLVAGHGNRGRGKCLVGRRGYKKSERAATPGDHKEQSTHNFIPQ